MGGEALLEGLDVGVDVGDEGVILLHGGAKESGVEVQIFPHGEVAVEGEGAGHIANVLPQLPIVAHHVVSVHRRAAALWSEEGA